MRTIKVHEAKSGLSALLAAVERGEEFVIARGDVPVARLVPLERSARRDLGFMKLDIDDAAFFDPLPEEELEAWGQ